MAMKEITAGIIAHVDAGKTTLSEAMLYQTGSIRRLGRVDQGNAFLDPDQLEKKRGITIFSHEAQLKTKQLSLTLLDTPGHVDFAAQTENVLSVLDYAILVISWADGVTGYTRTLWHLLKEYQVPTFIFVNKVDEAGFDQTKILQNLQEKLAPNCLAFEPENKDFYENIAASDDKVLTKFLTSGKLKDETIQSLIQKRTVFPVYFGSALKLKGVEDLIAGLEKWTLEPIKKDKFAARVFKISHDEKGERLTWLKLLGGNLPAKTELLPSEKVNQIRLYNGDKFTVASTLRAGQVGAITGLTSTYPGQGIGIKDAPTASLRPVMTYRVNLENNDLHAVLTALKTLEDEDPLLNVQWSEELQEIRVQIMGEVQLETLQQILQERFKLKISFDQGSILYKETITKKIEAVGHFEPLRHYAEVHFLLEPGKRNSGLAFANCCSLEVMTKNWQHQVMTALASKEHLGVLIGAPITDMKITLISGKGNLVHTVGGDLREATYRGVRQGLMELKQRHACQLLEPWYSFRLEVKQEQVGRALNDIQRMSGKFDNPVEENGLTIITGLAPVEQMQGYENAVRSYTHGEGHLECIYTGYLPCHNAQEVIKRAKYDPVSDLANTPNSVFCSHGAGHTVTWDQVPAHAQYPYTYKLD